MNNEDSTNPSQGSKQASISGNVSSVIPPLEASGSGEMRVNLSLQLLIGAANLSAEVGRIEAANLGKPWGGFFEQILSGSCGSVVMAVAAAESFINEVFVDRHHSFPERDQATLSFFWSEIERKPVIQKFHLAAQLKAKEDIDWGSAPFQAFTALVRLRNGIVHFTPEWPSRTDAHSKLSNKIADYVTLAEWLSTEPAFPRAWASHGSTKWAVNTVISFVSAFSRVTGIEDCFEKFQHKINP